MTGAAQPRRAALDRIEWRLAPVPGWQRASLAGLLALCPFLSLGLTPSMMGMELTSLPHWRDAIVWTAGMAVLFGLSAWWWMGRPRTGHLAVDGDAVWLPRSRAAPRPNRIALDRIHSLHRVRGPLGPWLMVGVSKSMAPYRVGSWWFVEPEALDELEDVLRGRIRTGRDGATRIAAIERRRLLAESARATLPWASIAVAAVLVSIFLAETFAPGTHGFAPWGGSLPELVWRGDWHRPFTSVLLHANAPHLLANVGVMLLLARNLENVIGRWRWLLVFLGGGVAGALASAVFREALLVGSSAGVYASFGVYLTLNLRDRSELPAPYRQGWWVLFFGIFSEIVFTTLYPSVSRPGHVGGFLAGALIAGWTLKGVDLRRASRKQGFAIRAAGWIAVALYAAASARGLWLFVHTDAPVVIR